MEYIHTKYCFRLICIVSTLYRFLNSFVIYNILYNEFIDQHGFYVGHTKINGVLRLSIGTGNHLQLHGLSVCLLSIALQK